MSRPLVSFVVCATLALVACEKTPTEKQADALSESGRSRADSVRERAKAEADALEGRATVLEGKAKAAGGYTGERLAIQAGAVSDEAALVRKQGRLQAEAVQESADAEAKAIRSR